MPSQPSQPASPATLPPPRLPAVKLRLPVAFLQAENLPEICLFSGRTDHLKPRPLAVDYVPLAVRLVALLLLISLIGGLLAAILYSLGRQAVAVVAPQARGAKFHWSLVRALPLPALLTPIAAGIFIGGHFDNGYNQAFAWGYLAGTVVGILLAVWTILWVRARTLGIRSLNATTLELRFPGRLRGVYDAYRDAYERWQAENRGSGARAIKLGGDREAWADAAAETGWDQSTAAKET